MVQFSGAGYTVLNVVAFPNLDYELPIFGVDIVILPGTAEDRGIDIDIAVLNEGWYSRPWNEVPLMISPLITTTTTTTIIIIIIIIIVTTIIIMIIITTIIIIIIINHD